MPTFGRWKYGVDREATLHAYAQVERGGSARCDCAGCRNFRLARARVFPAEFLALLDSLGIDPVKDAEVYRGGRVETDTHQYGGWYHFVGSLEETGDFPTVDFGGGFSAWMCRATAPSLSSLKALPTVQVEFLATAVPWLLDEPEPQ